VQASTAPNVAIIQGAWDTTSTNGPGALRCAWLTNNAILNGFTSAGGARGQSPSSGNAVNGGGVWGPPQMSLERQFLTSPTVSSPLTVRKQRRRCIQVTLNNCTIVTNIALGGGMTTGSGVEHTGAT